MGEPKQSECHRCKACITKDCSETSRYDGHRIQPISCFVDKSRLLTPAFVSCVHLKLTWFTVVANAPKAQLRVWAAVAALLPLMFPGSLAAEIRSEKSCRALCA